MPKLKVVFVASNSAFVDIPRQLSRSILLDTMVRLLNTLMLIDLQSAEPTVTLKLACGDSVFYAGWGGGTAQNGTIGLAPQFAAALLLDEGLEVDVSVVRGTPAAASVSVEPVSEDDWEIIVSIH